MRRAMLVGGLTLALLTIMPGNVLAGSLETASGRTVVDETPHLRAEVTRRERAAKLPLAEGQKDIAEAELAEARAHLATAQGLMDTTAAEWRKAIASREKHLRWALKNVCLTAASSAGLQGPLAEARGNLAEVEGRSSDLAQELRTVISCHQARLGALDDLRRHGVLAPQDVSEMEREVWKELRRARSRLDAVTRKLGTR